MRLTKRMTAGGRVYVAVSKNHGAPGGEPAEDVHGERGMIGVGSQAAILSLLSANFERRGGADPARVRQGDDLDAWEAAKQQYGSYEAVRAALDALPPRHEGEALRAADVPDGVLPDPAKALAERQRLASLKASGMKFILHGRGDDGRVYSLPVRSDADARSAGSTYLLAPGVNSIGRVTRERL